MQFNATIKTQIQFCLFVCLFLFVFFFQSNSPLCVGWFVAKYYSVKLSDDYSRQTFYKLRKRVHSVRIPFPPQGHPGCRVAEVQQTSFKLIKPRLFYTNESFHFQLSKRFLNFRQIILSHFYSSSYQFLCYFYNCPLPQVKHLISSSLSEDIHFKPSKFISNTDTSTAMVEWSVHVLEQLKWNWPK